MRNEKIPMDMDALLRDTARKDNAELPLADWKARLLTTVEQAGNTNEADTSILAFSPESRKPTGARRQWTIGLGAVAALLLIFGARSMWPSPPSSGAPQQNAAIVTEEFESTADMAETENAVEGAPPMPFDAPVDPAAEAPLASVAPAAPAPAAGTGGTADDGTGSTADTSAPANDERAAEYGSQDTGIALPDADTGLDSSISSPGGSSCNLRGAEEGSPEEKALLAVLAALRKTEADIDRAYAGTYTLAAEQITISPLDDQASQKQLYAQSVYVVVLDTREKEAPQYVVNASSLEVLGLLR